MTNIPKKLSPENLPDPWLFDSEKLLRELARCRELVLNVPINDNPGHALRTEYRHQRDLGSAAAPSISPAPAP